MAECREDYPHVAWKCAVLPEYRIIVCCDFLQYIVQIKQGGRYRNQSFHTEWISIQNRYPQLVLSGLPECSPNLLPPEIRRARGVAGRSGRGEVSLSSPTREVGLTGV